MNLTCSGQRSFRYTKRQSSVWCTVTRRHDSLYSAYADNVNVYSSIDASRPDTYPAINAVHALHNWYIRNGMLPNPNKSEVSIIGTRSQLAKLPLPLHIDVASSLLEWKNSIVSLGLSVDSGLTCNRRVNDIIRACNYHLLVLTHIRPAINVKTGLTVGRAIILLRLESSTTATPYYMGHQKHATPVSFTRIRCSNEKALASGPRAYRLETCRPDSIRHAELVSQPT